jgi:large subunit ribosomal protein L35
MPKLKTNRSAAKRYRLTGTGKIMRRRAFRNHILEKKSSKRTRKLAKDAVLPKGDDGHVRRMLGLKNGPHA